MSKKNLLAKIKPSSTGKFKSKEEVEKKTAELQKKMYDLLYLMFAHNKYSLLIILQGIDTSGKDGAIRHIFNSANPQGVRVFSFKEPTPDELRHDFLWRCHAHTPDSGFTSVFNRSYYEEVTTLMVHPELLEAQRLPEELLKDPHFFKHRYHRINDFEKLLTEKGTVVLKFFLHISKDEQKQRLQDRLIDHTRNWKFSDGDIRERKHWDKYMKVYEKMLVATDTKHAPWNVLPADHKWYRDYLISKLTVEALSKLKMSFPKARRKASSIR